MSGSTSDPGQGVHLQALAQLLHRARQLLWAQCQHTSQTWNIRCHLQLKWSVWALQCICLWLSIPHCQALKCSDFFHIWYLVYSCSKCAVKVCFLLLKREGKLTIHGDPLHPPLLQLLPEQLEVNLLLHVAREDVEVGLQVLLHVLRPGIRPSFDDKMKVQMIHFYCI